MNKKEAKSKRDAKSKKDVSNLKPPCVVRVQDRQLQEMRDEGVLYVLLGCVLIECVLVVCVLVVCVLVVCVLVVCMHLYYVCTSLLGVFSGKCLSMHQPWASLLVLGIKRCVKPVH